MGFGLLFIGYFAATLMSINVAGSFIRLAGYTVVLFASKKLSSYNRSFIWLSVMSIVMMIVSALIAAADITEFMYKQLIIDRQLLTDTYRNACGYGEMIASFAFNTAMLCAIRNISLETDVEKNAVAAIRNLIFIIIYYVLNIVGLMPFGFTKYLAAPTLILYFVWIILNLILIYSCYARICDESDVEMERKPSRFKFINNMRAESEQKRMESAQRRAEHKNKRRK